MKTRCLFAILIATIIAAGSACQPKNSNLPRFVSAQGLLKHVFPATHIKVDTIAQESHLSDFMYGNDSVCLKNFYMPLYPEYVKAESGALVPAIDTPALQYGNKQWTLPLKWKTDRLTVDFLFHIKTKTKNYLVVTLSAEAANGTSPRYSIIGWVDIDNGKTVCYIQGYLTSADNFVDYDNDGELEFLKTTATKIIITDKILEQYFTVNICKPTQNPDKPVYLLNKHGDSLSVSYYESEGELFLTEGLNN
jgi:hypothetical protein